MGLQRAGPPGAQPQMLIAVASARPLIAIREAKGTPASQVFPTAAQEIAREGQSVAVSARYFKLE